MKPDAAEARRRDGGAGDPPRAGASARFRSLPFVLLLWAALFTAGAGAQQWQAVDLPPGIGTIKTAGNPLASGAIAIWGLRSTVFDTSLQTYMTPWVLFTTADAGRTWAARDSGFFTRTLNPPAMHNWFQLAWVGGTITRTVYSTGGVEAAAYYFLHGDNGAPFVHSDFPGPTDNRTASPILYHADAGTLYNLRFPTGADSVDVALYKSSGPSTVWRIVPDSISGFHKLPAPTTLAFRTNSQNIMFLGTRYGIFSTGNGGLNWNGLQTGTPLDRSVVNPIAVHPRDGRFLYAGAQLDNGETWHHLYASSDNGTTWREVFKDSLLTHIALSAADTNAVLIGTQSSLYASTDRGGTWRSAHGNLPMLTGKNSVQWLFIDPGGSSTAWLALTNVLYKSDSWTAMDLAAPPAPSSASLDVFPNPAPSRDRLRIAVTLPIGGKAALSVCDGLGRVLSRLFLEGSQTVSLPEAAGGVILPGVSFIALESSSSRIVRACTILH